MKSRSLSLVLVALVLLGFGLALVQAQDDGAPVLEYRQRLMKAHSASMGSIGDILKYKLPYGSNHIAVHAANISQYAKLIPSAFEKNISDGLTDAKVDVWQNWNDFQAKALTLSEASADLASTAKGGDMTALMPKVKALGDACRGCHNTYRKPEEERFERN